MVAFAPKVSISQATIATPGGRIHCVEPRYSFIRAQFPWLPTEVTTSIVVAVRHVSIHAELENRNAFRRQSLQQKKGKGSLLF
jgi:hypothetical protein